MEVTQRLKDLNIDGIKATLSSGTDLATPPKDDSSASSIDRPGVKLLNSWLNKNIKVEMTDGRFLLGVFLCTDKSSNVIVGNCTEFTTDPEAVPQAEEPRILGLAMVPGHHIVKLYIKEGNSTRARENTPTTPTYDSDE